MSPRGAELESGIVQGLRRGEQVLKVKVEVKGQTKMYTTDRRKQILYFTRNDNPAALPSMFVCVLFAISL